MIDTFNSMLDDLISTVKRHKNAKGKTKWQLVAKVMNELYPDEAGTPNKWNTYYRWKTNGKYQERRNVAIKKRDDARVGVTNIGERLIRELKGKRELSFLAKLLDYSENDILAEATRLRLNGYPGIGIWNEEGKTFLQNITKQVGIPGARRVDLKGDTVKLAIVSDTHLGSNDEAIEELKAFYAYAEKQGVSAVLHVGDISDGYYTNRPTSIFEQHAVGFQNQLEYISKVYPTIPGVKTYFITGNHDWTHTRNGAANIGEVLANYRHDDLVYLGHNFGQFQINETVISLIHPTDGSSRTWSHKLQEIIDRNEARRGHIMLVGHYHKQLKMKYKGVHGYLVPSFQHQTGFMEDNNLTSEVGGLILTIKFDKDGNISTISTEEVNYEKK
jgi:UDP-2,3-diacylglucosamine pyrophosphatase LpxH